MAKNFTLRSREVLDLFGRPTVQELCRQFTQFKQLRVEQGELSPRTLECYRRVCDDLLDVFGRSASIEALGPADFHQLREHFARRLGPRGLGNYIRITRVVFNWAWEMGLLDQPKRYGGVFARPPKRVIRAVDRGRSDQLAVADIRRLLDATAGSVLHAFILLGINCAFGNNDCSELPADIAHQAAHTGLLQFPRPKTGIERSAVLWPETRQALAAFARTEGPAFLTRWGHRFVRVRVHHDREGDAERIVHIDALGARFRKIAGSVGLDGARFYNLRRTFRTVADSVNDPHAVARVMGHELPGMAGVYVQQIDTDRLRRISDHVRSWLGLA